MSGWSVIAVVASFLLALQPAPTVPAFVPCPVAELEPAPDRPAPPSLPRHAPEEPLVGGDALATAGLVVPPGVPDMPTDLSATSWLVADLDTGAVLGGCGPHEYGIPASTQKLLLAAALLPELDPDQVVEVVRSDMDFEPGSSAVGLLVGGEYTVETLWLGLLLNSGNDAANVLARIGGGDGGVEAGLRAMNEQARRLGAFQTHAVTTSGLDGPGQFTSAYDLALIARQLFDQPDFLRYAATERTDVPAQPHLDADSYQIQNQNDLLAFYPGALGGKTGYTDLARHSFVGAAERDGRRLVVTLLGAEQRPVPTWQQAAALLDWGFSLPATASVGRLVDPEDVQELAVSATSAPMTTPGTASPAPDVVALPDLGSPVVIAAVGLAVSVCACLFMLAAAGRRRRRPATARHRR
jgi:D-alanyl-D-alanine carboxypeptidase (penicillin-binding protein 5/6)